MPDSSLEKVLQTYDDYQTSVGMAHTTESENRQQFLRAALDRYYKNTGEMDFRKLEMDTDAQLSPALRKEIQQELLAFQKQVAERKQELFTDPERNALQMLQAGAALRDVEKRTQEMPVLAAITERINEEANSMADTLQKSASFRDAVAQSHKLNSPDDLLNRAIVKQLYTQDARALLDGKNYNSENLLVRSIPEPPREKAGDAVVLQAVENAQQQRREQPAALNWVGKLAKQAMKVAGTVAILANVFSGPKLAQQNAPMDTSRKPDGTDLKEQPQKKTPSSSQAPEKILAVEGQQLGEGGTVVGAIVKHTGGQMDAIQAYALALHDNKNVHGGAIEFTNLSPETTVHVQTRLDDSLNKMYQLTIRALNKDAEPTVYQGNWISGQQLLEFMQKEADEQKAVNQMATSER